MSIIPHLGVVFSFLGLILLDCYDFDFMMSLKTTLTLFVTIASCSTVLRCRLWPRREQVEAHFCMRGLAKSMNTQRTLAIQPWKVTACWSHEKQKHWEIQIGAKDEENCNLSKTEVEREQQGGHGRREAGREGKKREGGRESREREGGGKVERGREGGKVERGREAGRQGGREARKEGGMEAGKDEGIEGGMERGRGRKEGKEPREKERPYHKQNGQPLVD